MAGRAAPPLVLRFSLAHGFPAQRGSVLLEVLEMGRNRELEPASAAYFQLFRDDSLVAEHRSHRFFVSAAGHYKALALWDDGRTGEASDVFVTAGMIRDAGHASANTTPVIRTFDPHTHKVNRRTGDIEPRIVRRWHLVTILVALVVAAFLWWWQTGPYEQPAPRPADQVVVVPAPTRVPPPTKASVVHEPPTYRDDIPALLTREEAERRITANPKRYRLVADARIAVLARDHGIASAAYHREGVTYNGLWDAMEKQVYAFSAGDCFVLVPSDLGR